MKKSTGKMIREILSTLLTRLYDFFPPSGTYSPSILGSRISRTGWDGVEVEVDVALLETVVNPGSLAMLML